MFKLFNNFKYTETCSTFHLRVTLKFQTTILTRLVPSAKG